MPSLEISLLGPFQVVLDGTLLTDFETDKVRGLLAYLAVEGQRLHRRDHLAGLLWPDRPQRAARNNLRQALSSLRRTLGDRTREPPLLLASRRELGLNPQAAIWVDVAAFQALVDRAGPGAAPLDDQDVYRLQQAVELYQGDFLAEFHLPDSPPFEEWATVLRERLRIQVLDALQALTDHLTERQEYEQARLYALQQVALEPWREEAHRQLMRLYAAIGQPEAAVAQFERCRRILAQELKLEPMPETRRLYEQIRGEAGQLPDASPPGPPGPGTPPPRLVHAPQIRNAPSHVTPCIGRERERAQIAHLLRETEARLVTLTGPGGVGKSRLALQAATDLLDSFPQGVYFIPLLPVEKAELIPAQMANVLGLRPAQGDDPEQALLHALQDRRTLLVLDNFEHLISGAGFLARFLDQCRGPKLLVTSQVRLNLAQEHLLALSGLETPAQGTTQALLEYDAVTLFVQHARRVRPDFRLTEEEAGAVAAICRLVDGLPLAIRLAGALTRHLSCPEILRELERSLDLLASPLQDTPERHRSLRAVFEYSWALLCRDEQESLSRLAVFQGGFTRQAALEVAGCPLPRLLALADKSFLRSHRLGRFEMHETLRQFAREKLREQGDEARILARHGDYFADFLEERRAALAERDPEAVRAVVQELGNLRAGWQQALAQRAWPQVVRYVEGLGAFYRQQSRHSEAIHLYSQTLAQAEPGWGDPLQWARWQRALGEAYLGVGRMGESWQALHGSLVALDRPLPSSWKLGPGLLREFLGQLGRRLGSAVQAQAAAPATPSRPSPELEAAQVYERLSQLLYFAERKLPAIYAALRGLNRAEAAPPSPVLARLYANTCLGLGLIPAHWLAPSYGRLAERVARSLQDPASLAWVLEVLAIYWMGVGAWRKAEAAAREGAELARQVADPRRWEECTVILAGRHYHLGQLDQAMALWEGIRRSARQRGDSQVEAWGASGMAKCLLKQAQALLLSSGLAGEAPGPAQERAQALLESGLALLQASLAHRRQRPGPGTSLGEYGTLASLHLARGEEAAGLEAAQEALRILAGASPTTYNNVEGYSGAAEIFLRLWQAGGGGPSPAELERSARQALGALKRYARVFPIARPRALLWEGLLCQLQGKSGRARSRWRQGIQEAQRLGLVHEEALLHLELGRHLPDPHPERSRHLEQARALLRRMAPPS